MGVEIQMNPKRRSTENRGSRRFRYRGDVTLRRLGTGDTLRGTLLDLSVNGCLLRLPDLADLGVESSIEVCISSNLLSFRANASVRHRSRNRRLLGISFTTLSRSGQADLLELIADLESSPQPAHGSVEQITLRP
jgi:hypothetical protein